MESGPPREKGSFCDVIFTAEEKELPPLAWLWTSSFVWQVMVTNVTSLLKTVKAVEDEATRGTRALEATIECIKQELTVRAPHRPQPLPYDLLGVNWRCTASLWSWLKQGQGYLCLAFWLEQGSFLSFFLYYLSGSFPSCFSVSPCRFLTALIMVLGEATGRERKEEDFKCLFFCYIILILIWGEAPGAGEEGLLQAAATFNIVDLTSNFKAIKRSCSALLFTHYAAIQSPCGQWESSCLYSNIWAPCQASNQIPESVGVRPVRCSSPRTVQTSPPRLKSSSAWQRASPQQRPKRWPQATLLSRRTWSPLPTWAAKPSPICWLPARC